MRHKEKYDVERTHFFTDASINIFSAAIREGFEEYVTLGKRKMTSRGRPGRRRVSSEGTRRDNNAEIKREPIRSLAEEGHRGVKEESARR